MTNKDIDKEKELELDRLAAKMREGLSMNMYGFFTHAVMPCEHHPDAVYNVHTHGLEKSNNHKDLQIVLPVDPRSAHKIIWIVVHLIEDGFKCIPGKRTSEVFEGADVEFMLAEETGRQVIRILLPDENGKLPSDEDCNPAYREQIYIDTSGREKDAEKPNKLMN